MTVLLLAGTGDAKRIAWGLVGRSVNAVASLAGATRSPEPLPIPTRTGGFGDADGFLAFLREKRIRAVLDATHPFADRITARTAKLCAQVDIPYLYYLRPGWTPQAGDQWQQIDREEDAADHITKGQTVFLGTGRQTLHRFANLEGCRVICRQIDPPTAPFPFEGGEFLIGRPPFPVDREVSLFKALGIDCLVVKNAGGALSATKLTAARQLGLPVLMIKRPPLPLNASVVSDVQEAVEWAVRQ